MQSLSRAEEWQFMRVEETNKVYNTEIINFDKQFFKGKKCIVFDDVLTLGYSYARFSCALEKMGATVLGGYFLGRTLLY